MVSNLLHELGPGSNLSSLRLFLSEREQSSHPLHLKSSSGEWEFVLLVLMLSVCHGSSLILNCAETHRRAWGLLFGAEMTLQVKLWWEFPFELGR